MTADVDFGELAETVRDKCLFFGPVEQRQVISSGNLCDIRKGQRRKV